MTYILIPTSVDLVLAPGVGDSTSSLSYPYRNELVNSVIKDIIYIRAGAEDGDNFSVLGANGVFSVDLDFRKYLHIVTHFNSTPGSVASHGWLWGCRRRLKTYVGTDITWISLADFDVDEFKLVSA